MTNIYKILKDAPVGTQLYSPIFGECHLKKSGEYLTTVICGKMIEHEFYSEDGSYIKGGECLLFPSKENRDWSKFQRPFKDGDIIADEHGNIAIYKGTMWYNKKLADYYCGYRKWDNHFISEPKRDGHFGSIKEIHFATEEEKQKLFDAIKANGYKWNSETKTLDKLVEPKFKVGDRIKYIYYDAKSAKVVKIHHDKYEVDNGKFIYFQDENAYEITDEKFDISTLKPFDKVLMRSSNAREWVGTIYSHYSNKYFFGCGMMCQQCIPYEGNEYLLGTTNDCDEYYKTW